MSLNQGLPRQRKKKAACIQLIDFEKEKEKEREHISKVRGDSVS